MHPEGAKQPTDPTRTVVVIGLMVRTMMMVTREKPAIASLEAQPQYAESSRNPRM